MKTYWNVTYVCAALMLVLLALPFPWWWCATGIATVLLAGVAGAKAAPLVPMLRSEFTVLAVVGLVLGAILQGAGLFAQIAPLWSVGLMLSLGIPMASVAHDCQHADAVRRRLFALE
jgi:hypothetical protein